MSAPKDPEKYEEWRRKVSDSLKGNVPWNKGKHTGQIPPNKGIPMSDAQKAKVSASRRGIPRSPEDSARAAASNRGRKRTPEQRARMSAAQSGKVRGPETGRRISASKRGKPSHMKGKTHTEATRKKLSDASKKQPHPRGYKHDEAFRAKAIANNIKRWQNKSEDEKRAHLDKLHEGARNIINSWIEDAYAKRLDKEGILYKRQERIGWYRVDFYIESERRIIEVNGCYWHSCLQCGHGDSHPGKREEDAKRYEYLRRKGYIVEIVWEHDLPKKPYHKP